MTTYLIVGNGAAGTFAAEEIRKQDPEGKITIFTNEDMPFYYRIRLNDFVAGEVEPKQLQAKKDAWYEENRIDLQLNTQVIDADPEKKVVKTDTGQELSYDKLLLATGSHSFVPPIKGSDKKGVFTLRSMQDASYIRSWAQAVERVVVIGGGLLGLEAGNGLRKLGKEVTVVEVFPRLLPRQLDIEGGNRLQEIMEDMGFRFRLGRKTDSIQGDDQVQEIILDNQEHLPAQMVVISAGVRPNMNLANSLGLETDKGIKVDEYLMTSQQDIFAAGDVAQFKDIPYGIWPAAMEQGEMAGRNMAGEKVEYTGTTMATTLKVAGIDLASAGEIDVEGTYENVVESTKETYKKLVIDNNRVIGCILLGESSQFSKITKLMDQEKDVSQIKDQLLSQED